MNPGGEQNLNPDIGEQSSEITTSEKDQTKPTSVEANLEDTTDPVSAEPINPQPTIDTHEVASVEQPVDQMPSVTEGEKEKPQNEVLDELKQSDPYDLVVTRDKSSYVKIPHSRYDRQGERESVVKWVNTKHLGNIHVNNWKKDKTNESKVEKWNYDNEQIERPELREGVDIEKDGVSDEELQPLLEVVQQPVPEESQKPTQEKTTSEQIREARRYDGILVGETSYVKMPIVLPDPDRGEKTIHEWLPMENLSPVVGVEKNWIKDDNSPILRWNGGNTIDAPERAGPHRGLSDEEMITLLAESTSPLEQTKAKEGEEKVVLESEDKPEDKQEDVPKDKIGEDEKEEFEKQQEIIEEKARAVVDMPEEEKEEFREAAKSKEGFFASIKRRFSGKAWKNLALNTGISIGGSLAMLKGAGAAVASFGPVGAIGVGAVMLGLGGYAAYRTYKGMKETAQEQGLTLSEMIKEKGFLKGAAMGLAVSGVLKGGGGMLLPALVPGVGPMLPIGMVLATTAVEIGGQALLESNLNKKQRELLDKYMNSYEQRRYRKLRNQGYVVREGIDVSKIIEDINNPSITADEKKTAQKAAIATLRYLHEKTQDEKYKFLHYTQTDQNGKEVRESIDITTIGLQETEQSTDQYPVEELTGVNIESFIDTLDNEELIQLTGEAWSNSSAEDQTDLANEIVARFVGLEASDVEVLLSEDNKNLQNLIYTTVGVQAGTAAANLAITTVVAGQMISSGISQIGRQTELGNQIQEQYRNELDNNDASVSQYRDSAGREVNAIDLDNDGNYDLVHIPESNEYHARTMTGAGRLFEMQNPGSGNVVISQLESSTTGITGTVVGNNGQVLGVVHTDSAGNIGIINDSQLSSALRASLTDGTPAPMSISNIQPDGSAVVQVNGVSHNINLGQLNSIPGIEGTTVTEIIPGSSIITVESGDSVPSLLDKILAEAKLHNPNMQGERHELQNFLYRDGPGHGANDAAIRSELGLSNPTQPAEQFDIADSPTVMSWLEQLNNGQPVNLPQGSTNQIHTEGTSGINFNFDRSLSGVDLSSLVEITPPVADMVDGPTIGQALGGIAGLGIAALVDRQTGGIEKETIWSVSDPELPTPDPVDPIQEYTRKILITQVFGKDYRNRFKVLPGLSFDFGDKKLTSAELGWFVDGDLMEAEDVVDALLDIEEGTRVEILTKILDSISSADGRRGRRRIALYPSGDEGIFQKETAAAQENSFWVEYNSHREVSNRISSRTLALRILRIREDQTGSYQGNIPLGEEILAPEQVQEEEVQQEQPQEEQVEEASAMAGSSIETENQRPPIDSTNLDSIKDYRPFVEDIVRRNVSIEDNSIKTSNRDLERFLNRAKEELDKENIPLEYESLIDVLTEQLERRIILNKNRMDQLGQSQGIEIEILRPISRTFREGGEYQEWIDRYGGRGFQPTDSSRQDYARTQDYGIPQDEGELEYQTYEMSPRPSLSATEMGTILSMLTYANFIERDALENANERDIYSLHISTSFPSEITTNPQFKNMYSKIASILAVGYSSIQRLGFEPFKQGGDIISIKGIADITRTQSSWSSTAIEALTEEQREEMREGKISITEMRGFDVNKRTPSLLINKNYIDAAIRMSFQGDPKAKTILEDFMDDSYELIKSQLNLTAEQLHEYISNPENTEGLARILSQKQPEEIEEFRKGIAHIVRQVRRAMIDNELIPEYL